jgi:epoxyqueuosine reductase QueG
MQFMLAISALMAAIVATAANDAKVATLALSLSPNATDVLIANGIWAPNLTAFAQGEPNTAYIDAAAEGKKLIASGIDINDLVHVNITTAVAVSAKGSCDRCNLCMKACAATALLWFL